MCTWCEGYGYKLAVAGESEPAFDCPFCSGLPCNKGLQDHKLAESLLHDRINPQWIDAATQDKAVKTAEQLGFSYG